MSNVQLSDQVLSGDPAVSQLSEWTKPQLSILQLDSFEVLTQSLSSVSTELSDEALVFGSAMMQKCTVPSVIYQPFHVRDGRILRVSTTTDQEPREQRAAQAVDEPQLPPDSFDRQICSCGLHRNSRNIHIWRENFLRNLRLKKSIP
jgi:hypothetical protein